jgi:hypothetical protein
MDFKSLTIGILSSLIACLLIYVAFLRQSIAMQMHENDFSRAYIQIVSDCLQDNQMALNVVMKAQGDEMAAIRTIRRR